MMQESIPGTTRRTPCAKPGCASPAVVREDVKDSRGVFVREPKRSYVLCERHDLDYFKSGNRWLTREMSDRIAADLIPYAVAA